MQRVIPIKNVDEINLIKDYYRKKGELNYLLMFTLSINTGIDLSRLLSLKVKEVKGKDYFECDSRKLVPLTDELKELIKQNTKGRKGADWLFVNKNGNKYDRIWIFHKFKAACKELGLSEKYSVASWRRTFAYHYYERYKDLSYLMWRFNQISPQVTLKYIDEDENMNFRFREGVCL